MCNPWSAGPLIMTLQRYYLEGCKHKVLMLTDHNNLYQFIETKNLSSRQVHWAQELSKYHFRIDYYQDKVNNAADTLFCFPQRCQNAEEKLQAENTQILHHLQSSLTNASLSGLNTSAELSLLHQVLIAARMSYLNYVNSRICSKQNWVMRAHTKSALVLCIWGSQSYRNQMTRLKKSG